jgi:hypothetical protein
MRRQFVWILGLAASIVSWPDGGADRAKLDRIWNMIMDAWAGYTLNQ